MLESSPPRSLYRETAGGTGTYPALAGAQRARVAIVGGGFTGLSAALHLAEAGDDVCLLEAHQPGWAASGTNGGHGWNGRVTITKDHLPHVHEPEDSILTALATTVVASPRLGDGQCASKSPSRRCDHSLPDADIRARANPVPSLLAAWRQGGDPFGSGEGPVRPLTRRARRYAPASASDNLRACHLRWSSMNVEMKKYE
ncbi:FAD-binding oxidoreductase [Mesorhizobium sp. ES1-3]|uniref:FAD-binding oxidoreductase n=1 Tax=Mesorhizobium sp. ES1-3 TaxID=2876628 RepID=UPI0029624AE5|nr:FAD-binding oxidoreductase [Mesorhizobium sp. ES1-3]